MQVHSVPVEAQPQPCVAAAGAPAARLRADVLGYGLSRPGAGGALRHRLLPCAAAVIVIDVEAGTGVVTGARDQAGTVGDTTWGRSVSVGFTPAGAVRLLGTPMSEVHGLTVPLADVLGRRRAGELVAACARDRPFALLDALFGGWRATGGEAAPVHVASAARPRLRPAERGAPGHLVSAAWRRLQTGERPRVGTVAAELGVGRRRLEREFRRDIGLSPGTVARIARFQRAVGAFVRGATPADAAVASGYADQPHLSREVRAMAGLTPVALRAIFQDRAAGAA